MGSDAVTSAPAKTAEDRTGLVAQTGAALSQVSAPQAGDKAKGFIDQQVASGADFLGYVGHSARVAADTLHPDAPQLAGFVRGVATSVSDLSDIVRGQSPEALLETASDYVRNNPALVLSAAAACGFALAPLLQGGVWNGSRSNPGPR